MKKTERLWIGAAAAAVLLLACKVAWDRRPVPPLSQALISADAALVSDDASSLLRLIDPLEREALKLDKDKLKRLLQWRRTLIGSEKPSTDKPSLVNDDADSVASIESYHRAGDKKLYVGFGAYRGEDGPRVNVVGDLVVFTLYHAYSDRYRDLGKVERKWPAVSYGLREHRPALEAMGLRGHFTGPPNFEVQSWASLQEFADAQTQGQ